MKIEAGKFYKTRDGRTVGPITRGPITDAARHWGSDDNLGAYVAAWFEDGSFWPAGHACKNANNAKLDLILPAYPEQGTLKEIGAKPGDLVEFVEWEDGNDEHGAFAIGKHYTHTGNRLESGIGYFMIRDAGGHIFRIISRASDTPASPVRTVTTTRISSHGTWSPRGKMPKTQYVYEVEFDLDGNGHPDWSTATVKGK